MEPHYMFNHINIRYLKKPLQLILIFAAAAIFSCAFKPGQNEIRSEAGPTPLELPDGTRVTLRQGARLIYADDFGTGLRREVMIEGEGYFEIEHDPRRRFVAYCNGVAVTVLGTAFNIRLSPTTGEVEVTVTKGKVSISDSKQNFGNLLTHRQVVIDPKRHVARYPLKINIDSTLAWVQDSLTPGNYGVASAISTLETRYNTHIILENKTLYECTRAFNFALNDSIALPDLVNVLAQSLNATVEPHGDYYVIRGGQCN